MCVIRHAFLLYLYLDDVLLWMFVYDCVRGINVHTSRFRAGIDILAPDLCRHVAPRLCSERWSQTQTLCVFFSSFLSLLSSKV